MQFQQYCQTSIAGYVWPQCLTDSERRIRQHHCAAGTSGDGDAVKRDCALKKSAIIFQY
jgi:hypothetical protein